MRALKSKRPTVAGIAGRGSIAALGRSAWFSYENIMHTKYDRRTIDKRDQ
jgi:hypothetical protein